MNDVASALPFASTRLVLLSRSEILGKAVRQHLQSIPHCSVVLQGSCHAMTDAVDLVLLDAGSYALDECLGHLRSLHHQTVALINAAPERAWRLVEARPSIKGVFYPTTAPHNFTKGLKEVLAGGDWLPRSLMEKLVRRYRQLSQSHGALGQLSARELEIMQLAGKGLSNAAIAAELHLSTHTVKSHVHNALHKLGASNRAQGAAIVLGAGASA